MEANPQQTIKLVVLDIDGTLLNSKIELSERNERALKAAIAEGVQIVLATGKTRNAGEHLIKRLGLTSPGIYLQGLTIYDPDGTLIWQQALDPAVARQVITFGEDRGFHFLAYNGTRIMVRSHSDEVVENSIKYHEPAPEVVGPLQNLLDSMPINKLMAVGEARAITALRWQLNAQLNGSIKLVQANIPEMLEILPPGGSKGTALKVLLKQLQIPAEQVMAMGDGENDIEMLQVAGLGVAIGNAEQKLKDVAKVVVGTNDEDGVAEAIERFVIRRKLDIQESGETTRMIDTAAAPADPDADQPKDAKPEAKAAAPSDEKPQTTNDTQSEPVASSEEKQS